MQIIKDIAAVVGLILSCFTLTTLCSTKLKGVIASMFAKYNKAQYDDMKELKRAFAELKDAVDTSIEESRSAIKVLNESSEISIEFTKQQCRNIIKQIFYKYYDEKVLPLYEHKTLMAIEEIYVNKCHGNSYAQEMLKIMSSWEIDYTKSHIDED